MIGDMTAAYRSAAKISVTALFNGLGETTNGKRANAYCAVVAWYHSSSHVIATTMAARKNASARAPRWRSSRWRSM